MMRSAISWLVVVGHLLGAMRRRARARRREQERKPRFLPASVAFVFAAFYMLMLQIYLAYNFSAAAQSAAEVAVDDSVRIHVTSALFDYLGELEKQQEIHDRYVIDVTRRLANPDPFVLSEHDRDVARDDLATAKTTIESWRKLLSQQFGSESRLLAFKRGGTPEEWQDRLQQAYSARGTSAFVSMGQEAGPASPTQAGALIMLFGVWWVSLALMGGGAMLDVTRRRHPMWEWYLGFPIPQSAVFSAEAIAPVITNPLLLLSPVLFATVIGNYQNSFLAGLCALPLAIPLTLSAAIWTKALEVLIMLRCSIRKRGVWFGVMMITGLLALIGPLFLPASPDLTRSVVQVVNPAISQLAGLRFLLEFDGFASWLGAAATTLAIGLVLAASAFLIMRLAVSRGLESGFGRAHTVLSSDAFRKQDFANRSWLRDPLFQKEWLWLKRDNGVLIQLFGMPLLLVGMSWLTVGNRLGGVELTWNVLAAIVVLVGTTTLFSSGHRALAAESRVLTLTLSWPRSPEDSVRMKVRLLFALTSAMVWLSLLVLIWMFPADAWKLLLVGVAWVLLGLSIAEKAVTLMQAPSQAGEPESLAPGQMEAVSLGNLTFPIALMVGQWQLAGIAIVLNWIFAGALWQGFRNRLPYLFDHHAEPALRPPTILSSLIATVGLMELTMLFIAPLVVAAGRESVTLVQPIAYGLAALVVCVFVVRWHSKQGVRVVDILRTDENSSLLALGASASAVPIGLALGLIGIGYQHLLLASPWPELQEPLEESVQLFANVPGARVAFAIMAVGIAPWVEEFLFRGLMFRAMLPQWGLTIAVLASSTFFTILHPAMAWPMVFTLGVINALMFAKTRRLLPCVVLHACYNAVIVGLT